MISVKNLQKDFGGVKVLKGLSTEIEKGDVICVIGPSGSGKSTFLRCLNMLERPSGGQIIFGVQNQTWDVIGFSDDEVFQRMDAITNSIFDACEPAVVPIMSIEEMDDRKIIVATIRSSMAKPYYLR